jgi:uncharacterized protein DUF5681
MEETMATIPRATPVLNGGKTAENRRDPHGRFTAGTAPGPGRPRNPYARRQAALRRAALAEVHATDMRALVRVLLTRALAGDLKAAEVLFAWVIGPPPAAVHPDRLDADEAEVQWQTPSGLERLLLRMAQQEGTPADGSPAAAEDDSPTPLEPRLGWEWFVAERCEFAPGYAAPVELLWQRYVSWCATYGRLLWPQDEIMRWLAGRGAVLIGSNGDRAVQGLRVLE